MKLPNDLSTSISERDWFYRGKLTGRGVHGLRLMACLVTSDRDRKVRLWNCNDATLVVDMAQEPGWIWLTDCPDYHAIATSGEIS